MLPGWAEVSDLRWGEKVEPGSGSLSWEFEKETVVSSHSGLKIPNRISGFSSVRFEWEVISLSLLLSYR